MSVKIILFGKLADIAGGSVSVDNVADTDSLINALNKDYPEFTKTKYLIAVDKQVIKENQPGQAAILQAQQPIFIQTSTK